MPVPLEPASSGNIFDSITLDALSDPAAWWSCTTDSLRCAAGEIIVLRVAGELDLFTLPKLRLAVDSSLARRPAHLVVDLTRMIFCSVRGLDLLTHLGSIAAEKNAGYAVSGVSPHLDRIWALGWAGDLPVRYRSTVVAVAAIRAASYRSA